MALTQENDTTRDRAVRLFTFLKELSELQTKTIRRLSEYEKVLWLADIPHQPQCRCAVWFNEPEKDQETWVRIERPRLSSPPEPPDDLKPWLDPAQVNDSSLEMPELRRRIAVPLPDHNEDPEAPRFIELSEHPEIEALWEQYVEKHWWPWAEKDKRLQPVQKVYTDLFSIYQKQQRLGEKYEVILGLGLLVWRTPGGHEVRRHLITAQTNISFDASRGIITVGPAGEGAKLTLEQDMLEAQERPGPVEQKAIEDQLEEIGDAIWNKALLEPVLKAWVHAVSARGQYEDVLVAPSQYSNEPRVYFAPALILRQRTERSLIRMFQDIIEQLRQGKEIPTGVKRLVEIVDDLGPETHRNEQTRPSTTRAETNIYFPLHANKEQEEIVRRLATHQGVLVQGPPGTGKSHTIANLICHLLATGQKVLVTSQTPRALKVLHDMLPDDLRNLCVSLLGDDRLALQRLEECVQGITRRYNHWDPAENEREIRHLEQELDQARRKEAEITSALRAIREAETYQHHLGFGGYEGTAAAIAKRLRDEEPVYGWIGEPEAIDGGGGPPLSNHEASALLQLLRIFHHHEQPADTCPIEVPSAELLEPAAFTASIRLEAEARAASEALETYRKHPGYPALRQAAAAPRETLIAELENLLIACNTFAHHPQSWVNQAAIDVLAGQDERWRALYHVTGTHLGKLKDLPLEAAEYQVTGLENRDFTQVKADAIAVLEHLEAGKGLGWGPFRDKVIKNGWYLLTQVRVNGCPCDNIDTLRVLLQWLEVMDRLRQLHSHWHLHTVIPDDSPRMQWSLYQDLIKILSQILELDNMVSEARQALSAVPGLPEPAWHESDEILALINALRATEKEDALREASKPLLALEDKLHTAAGRPNSCPIYASLLDAVRNRDGLCYNENYQTLCRLEERNRAIAERDTLLARLGKYLPRIAEELLTGCHAGVWDERMARFEEAWNWARADRWLRERNDPSVVDRLSLELKVRRARIREITGKLAAAKAWRHFFLRMNEHQRQHLMAWTLAVRKGGKWTGKYAVQRRREAQRNMEECRSAIPAWIMPIYRVAESVRPDVDAFDVVIVDEASQSGPEALFLQYLAKKIIIVGDDKQISPEFVGLNREDVNLLRERYLADIPLKETFDLETSLFDQADIRYPGRIRLREHFRCMPEIIQFCNNLCYSAEPLIPLRQYGTQRLEPIKVTHVPGGYRTGSGNKIINPPEAEAIVEQIVKCINDPAYEGKSMGVISLQGPYQAQEIERLLVQRIGPEEMERRNLVCGDAYDFQGDERHIIFLSLVAAPSEQHRIGPLTKASDQRRFNVAASRARDQLWLFHTATLNDLNPECVRYRLLDYCLHPRVQPESANLDVPEDTLVDPFESLFEQHVYLKIVRRGYRVVPQYEVAGYRIDLVVQGMQGQMAVECDGDTWHGPSNYEADMRRQRQLERCGWTFWRVRASQFYRDPDAAMEGLWPVLDRLGIYPAMIYTQLETPLPPMNNNNETVAETAKEQDNTRATNADPPGIDAPSGDLGINKNPEDEDEVNTSSAPYVTDGGTEPPHCRVIVTNRGSVIKPYQHWHPQTVPDPRVAPLTQIAQGLIDIIATEGPVVEERVYRLYSRAAGIQKTGRQIRSTLHRALGIAVRQGLVIDRTELHTQNRVQRVVRLADTPEVVLRTRGDRTLEEIPLSEIAAVMHRLLGDADFDREQLFRNVLDHYDLVRLTKSTQDILNMALRLLHGTQSQGEYHKRGILRRLK